MSRFTKWLLFFLLGLPLIFAVVVFFAWKISPSFQEKVVLLGLASGNFHLQRTSVQALRDYPTKTSAISLIAFANLKYRPPKSRWVLEQEARKICEERTGSVSSEQMLESCIRQQLEQLIQEQKKIEKERQKDEQLAEQAVKSLCILTGYDFGSYYEKTKYGFSWGSLSEERWPKVLGKMNSWALRTFGSDTLGAMGMGGLQEQIPQVFQEIQEELSEGVLNP